MKDTIDVEHTQSEYEGRIIHGIALILNGQKINGTFDARVFAATKDFEDITIEILTCGCGHAGCAGIFYGTKIFRKKDSVEWSDIDCGFPKKNYKFSVKMYDAAVEKTVKIMYDIATLREQTFADDPESGDWDYHILSFANVKELEASMQHTAKWLKRYNKME